MSSSSLWIMDKEFKGEEIQEFSNSWCFSPIVLDILFKEYLHNGVNVDKTFITESMFNRSVHGELNNLINCATNQEDRVLWELANQQVFFTKDKEFIAKAIKNFLQNHPTLSLGLGQHIVERFVEVANEILNIDENEYPNFVFKNTSCDDGVENWFEKYNEDLDEYENGSLKDIKEIVCEFVIIENENVKNFITNINYFQLLQKQE